MLALPPPQVLLCSRPAHRWMSYLRNRRQPGRRLSSFHHAGGAGIGYHDRMRAARAAQQAAHFDSPSVRCSPHLCLGCLLLDRVSPQGQPRQLLGSNSVSAVLQTDGSHNGELPEQWAGTRGGGAGAGGGGSRADGLPAGQWPWCRALSAAQDWCSTGCREPWQRAWSPPAHLGTRKPDRRTPATCSRCAMVF